MEVAEAELAAQHFDAAEAAADRALQIRPDGIEALNAKAEVLLERGKEDKKYLRRGAGLVRQGA